MDKELINNLNKLREKNLLNEVVREKAIKQQPPAPSTKEVTFKISSAALLLVNFNIFIASSTGSLRNKSRTSLALYGDCLIYLPFATTFTVSKENKTGKTK